jgi:CDP-glycerol glycerophosphotransferase (TagB/SpsB family)
MNWPKELDKRAGQIHVQTQHGTPLLTTGIDLREIAEAAPELDVEELMHLVDRWDFNLSSNRYSSEIWDRTYPAYFEELEYGYPRNDRLLTATVDDVRAIRASLGYDDSHLVVLYAPTGRALDPDQLAGAVGDHCRVITRPRSTDHARDEELMLAADVLISDYSSITFDYANLDRPIVLFIEGTEQHHTYFDVAEFSPGLVARSLGELRTAFRTGAFASPEAAKHRHLYREKFCEYDDGRAAERVVRRVILGEVDVPAIEPLSDRRPAPSPYFMHNG